MATNSVQLQPAIPLDPDAFQYNLRRGMLRPDFFNGWQRETLSWKQAAYLGSNLTMAIQYLSGPDAARLLSENCTSNIANMKSGRWRHVIMCSEKGNIIRHGVVLRISEEEFECYSLDPCLEVLSGSGRYNVKPMSKAPFKDFIFQIGGPKSLEILENAAQEDLHDIEFMTFRPSSIAGHKVRVLRMGMVGTLGYEVQGSLECAHEVYTRIFETGKKYGMEKLGAISYTMCNHTENGFPQSGLHFLTADYENPEYAKYYKDTGIENSQLKQIAGSLSDKPEDYYRNPLELGWQGMINFKHNFPGRDALQKIKETGNYRRIVSLEWNKDDILDTIGSYFQNDTEPYKMMDFPRDNLFKCSADKVLDQNGKTIGAAMGRIYTLYYRQMISMAVVDPGYAGIGTEVKILWGDTGSPQKEIRAKVARYPYLDLVRNENFDVETIPHYKP